LPLILLLIVFNNKNKDIIEIIFNKVADIPTTVKAFKILIGKDLKSALANLTEKDIATKKSPIKKKKN
jgi:hypothetical protein